MNWTYLCAFDNLIEVRGVGLLEICLQLHLHVGMEFSHLNIVKPLNLDARLVKKYIKHWSLIIQPPAVSLFPLLWKFKYKIHLRAICQGELDIGRIKFLKVFPDMAEYLCTVSDKTMTVFFDVRLNILILTPYFLSELLCTGALWPRFVVSHISDWLHCNPNQPKSQSKELERVCSCHWNCRLPALCELTQHFIRLHCASLPQTLISRFYLKI